MTDHKRDKVMIKNSDSTKNPGKSLIYQIRIKGHLDSQWTDWFEGMTITLEDNGETLLSGPVIDQAALHGLLKKVRNLGMPLISVCPLKTSQKDEANANPPTSIHETYSYRSKKGDTK
jgi:hypothetical protein